MDGIVEAILNVAVKRWHEAVPKASFSENQETDAVDLVHHLDDAGEKGLGDPMAVVRSAGQQQIFELVKGHDHRHLEAEENLHEHLEQCQHQVLPAGPHLEIQL